jgi:mevalonate kinase
VGRSPDLHPVGRVVDSMAQEFAVSPRVHVSIASSIPEGAGLGSSAATMVAVAAAFSRYNSLGLRVDEIIQSAMAGEEEVHGRPSGIDPTVSAHGGVLLFRPGSEPKTIHFKGTRSLLVTYSGRKRSTKRQISRVAEVKSKYPSYFDALSASIGELSLEAADRLKDGDMAGLGRLLTANHAVLGFLGVTTPEIDELVERLDNLGCYGAKVTGAGGGGSLVAVAPKAKEKSIVSGLSARGFETFKVSVPSEGVKSWLER